MEKDFQAEHLGGVDSKEQRSGRLRLESSVLYLGIKPLAVLQLALARRIFLGNVSSPRLATETTKESILWLIICSTDWRPSNVVSAEDLHLVGRPCMVRRIFLCNLSIESSSDFESVHISLPYRRIGRLRAR